jgi:succinate dehydrogenase / fumarate reductase cytochrome b subunit
MATTTRPAQPTAPKPARRLPWLLEIYRTGVGKKYAMAITGVFGMLYVVGHMAGNIKLYLGDTDGVPAIDHYGEWLRSIGYPALPHGGFLWIMRVLLVGALIVHVHAAWSLTRMNKRANAPFASERDYIAASWASRTMRWTGIIVLAFIAFHLMDLTWGNANPDFVRGAVRHNMIESFTRWPVTIAYVIANLALGVHLWHGAWSLFQSLGVNNPRFKQWRVWFAWGFATVVVLGNVSFPLAIATGIVD